MPSGWSGNAWTLRASWGSPEAGAVASVLCIDDDPDWREVLSLHFTHEGYTVVCCSSAEEAMALLAEQRFDLVLVDLELPGIDGAEFCRWLRKRPDLADRPAILFTGVAERHGIPISENDKSWIPADEIVDKVKGVQELVQAARKYLPPARRDPE